MSTWGKKAINKWDYFNPLKDSIIKYTERFENSNNEIKNIICDKWYSKDFIFHKWDPFNLTFRGNYRIIDWERYVVKCLDTNTPVIMNFLTFNPTKQTLRELKLRDLNI